MTPYSRLLRLAVFPLSLILIMLAIIGGVIGYSPVPYWDMWGATLNFVLTFEDAPFNKLFAQHNEHRIVLSRLLFLLDYQLFGGTSTFLVVCNYLFALAIWIVFARCVFKLNPTHHDPTDLWLLVFGLGAWLFLWSQKVNFTWAFQSQFFLAQLLPLCAFLSLSHAADQGRIWGPSFLAAIGLGGLSTLTMANGLFVLPIMLFGALLLRMKIAQLFSLAICAALVGFLYLSDYHHPSEHGAVRATFITDPIATLIYTFRYLGNVGVYLAGSSGVIKLICTLAGFGLAVLTVLLARNAVRTRPSDPVSCGLLLFIIFIGAGAFVTAAGRLVFGLDSAFSSRYTTPVLMAWAAMFCLASPTLLEAIRKSERVYKVSLTIAVAMLCALMVSQIRALTPQDHQRHDKQVTLLAMTLGIRDDDLISQIHPQPDRVLRIANAAARAEIGIFAHPNFAGQLNSLGQLAVAPSRRTCAGGVNDFARLANDPAFVRISGWQVPVAGAAGSGRIDIFGPGNIKVGAALSGRPTPGLKSVYGKRARHAGFVGYIRIEALNQDLHLISAHCQTATVLSGPEIEDHN